MDDVGVKKVLITFTPQGQQKLIKRTLQRSVDLGRRVSMGFVIEELMALAEQLENPEQRSAELFAAQE